MNHAGVQIFLPHRVQYGLCRERFRLTVAADDLVRVKTVHLADLLPLGQLWDRAGTRTVDKLLTFLVRKAEVNDVFRAADVHIHNFLAEIRIDRHNARDVQNNCLRSFLHREKPLQRLLVRQVAGHDFRFFRYKTDSFVSGKNKRPYIFAPLNQLPADFSAKKPRGSGYKIFHVAHSDPSVFLPLAAASFHHYENRANLRAQLDVSEHTKGW